MARIRFHDLPIRQKLRRATLFVVIAIGVFVSLNLAVDDYSHMHSDSKDRMAALAAVLGRGSAAGISFNDNRDVEQELALLQEVPNIVSGTISLPDGTVFARYERENTKGKEMTGILNHLHSISQPIVLDGEAIGRIEVKWEMREKSLVLARHVLMVFLFTSVVAVCTLLIFDRLVRTITGPITLLSNSAGEIGKGNLSQRVEVTSKDEIGELAASFNQMAENLLKTTVSRDELAKEIEERKRAEESLEKAHGELQEKSKYLERLNRQMVGRETRVLEMKKEVNDLLERLGEAKRYEWTAEQIKEKA